MKNRGSSLLRYLCVLAVVAAGLMPADAKNLGGDPPSRRTACGAYAACSSCSTCSTCSCSGCRQASVSERSDTSSSISRTEGNLTECFPITMVRSSSGPTLQMGATYNSYNANPLSRTSTDTVMGYGWTHTFNVFLFSQFGNMFRFGADGRITRYSIAPGQTYATSPGYFEKLVTNPDGSFTITTKDKTVSNFKQIAGTSFYVSGPVWRITSMINRDGNTTTYTYTGGNLATVTDTYGRSLTFTYNAQNHLSSVTDPDGRVTSFQYDSTGHLLSKVTDPLGNTIQYFYDVLNDLTTKMDKAGRRFTYTYVNYEPVAVYDSTGTGPATLSNATGWATNALDLALYQMRVYTLATTTNTDGRGNKWQYAYDANGYIDQIIAPDGATTKYSYDPTTLQISSMTDANGNTTTYIYDANGNMLSMTDALGHITTYTYDATFNQMTSMTDPRGRVTTYTIDPTNGNQTQKTDPLGQTEKWTYDSHGNILTYTDKNGHVTTNTYDSFGDRTQTKDSIGNVTTQTYDAVGNLISTTDANGHTTSYQYDGMNRIIVATDATGHTDQTIYDGEGNRIATIDRDGHVTKYTFDQRQRLIETTDALNQNETYTYDGNDNRISFTDKDGHTTTYGYDVQNRQNQVTDALSETTTNVYDGDGNVISRTDANGHTTTNTYDQLNRRASTTDALGEETLYFYDTGTFTGPVTLGGVTVNCSQCGATPGSDLVTEQVDPDGTAGLHAGTTFFKYDALDRLVISERKTGCIAGSSGSGCPDTITPNDALTLRMYDPQGNRLTLTQPDGNTTTDMYDADNRLIQDVNAAGDTTITTYDPVGNISSVTAPNGDVTTNTYDALNRLSQVNDSAGLVAKYTYDPVGNQLSQSDGDGNVTTNAYDAINRLNATTDPLGKSTTYQYDPVGNQTKVIDRNNNATAYSHDAVNRRIAMTDALGNTTQYQYDKVGNLIKITDANSHATQYSYDAVNRPLQETYADTLSRSYSYDPVGNLTTRTDQKGQTTTYSYNDLYFLSSRAYPISGTDTFTYDLSGRILSAQRGSWPESFAYDGASRLLQSVQNGQTISYSYNIPGRTRTITYPGGRVITEHTDARWRIDHIDDAGSPPPIVQYTYDAANNVLSRNYRNGTTSSFTYNATNWTTSIAHDNPSMFAGFNYVYDNEGNKQYEQKNQDTTHSEAYQYDSTYRLITYSVGTLVGSTVPIPSTQTSYSLDPVGNWNSMTTNGVTQTRTHNATNELVQINSTTLTYDANGNLTNDGSYSYAYDEENRLTQVTRLSDSALVGHYTYDAFSRRVEKIADPAGVSTTTLYFYDDTRILEEQNSTNVTQATYVYGNYVDEALTMNRGVGVFYYHQNALWSVEAITDSTGAAVECYAYDAYGGPSINDCSGTAVPPNGWGTAHSAIGNPWMFTGRQFDEETGLYYYRARYYDPAKGRLLQRDPAEDLNGVNLYEYVNDNPINNVDPTGLHTVQVKVDIWDYWSVLRDTHVGDLAVDYDFNVDRCRIVGFTKAPLENVGDYGVRTAISGEIATEGKSASCCCDRQAIASRCMRITTIFQISSGEVTYTQKTEVTGTVGGTAGLRGGGEVRGEASINQSWGVEIRSPGEKRTIKSTFNLCPTDCDKYKVEDETTTGKFWSDSNKVRDYITIRRPSGYLDRHAYFANLAVISK